ncbi:Component of a membrane-bound complex containing the Tor2p kinase [Malassezia brasiliensis]|uniref:Component of a membrane-bound complex containing the Tor2p kinase n=1 Tax=Malassezia brasiliensis TaxID=1821822 RepID=A0AAF0IUD3_9BASI|nr:Component of a membrane-bound complex containing the Tor2p kinase [Malassezia brasiliensis]
MALARSGSEAIQRLRQDYLQASDDPVIARVLAGSAADELRHTSPSSPALSPSASEYAAGTLPFRFHDETYTEEVPTSLSESPVHPVNLDAVKALFQQHFPHEPWPLAEEDEALFPTKYNSFVPGALHGAPDDLSDGRPALQGRLHYTQTIYGPRQSGLLGMRVSGTRRSGIGSISTHTQGTLLNTETPNAGTHDYLSRTIQLQDASARLGVQADSAETMVNPAASSLGTTMMRLSPGVVHSIQSPPRPLQGAAEESDLASSVDSDTQAGVATTLASMHISPSELHSVPGLFPTESSRSSAILDSEPSRPPSSLSSASNETAASDSLRPYLPGSFILPPEEERELSGAKRTTRTRRKSRAVGPLGADDAKGSARTDRRTPALGTSPQTEEGLAFRRGRIVAPHTKSLLTYKLQKSGSGQSHVQMTLARYRRAGVGERDPNGYAVTLYFPHPTAGASAPPLDVRVRRDATMEELIGYGLSCFVDHYGQLPQRPDTDDADLEAFLETEAWALYMTEDGLVDEDYPAIDRTLVVGRFGENEFAVCARPYVPKAPPRAAQTNHRTPPDTALVAAHSLGLSPAADELGEGASLSRIALHIMVVPGARGMTTVRVPPDFTAQQVLHAICEQCQLGRAHTYALLFRDVDEVVPGDRSVRGFAQRTDLVLVERTSLPDAPSDAAGLQRRSSKVPEQPKYKTAMDLISNYKAYTISRRHPISVGRHERVLTIDGDWIHIIRPAEKRMFQARSTSYPISAVLQCEQYARMPNLFKLVVVREKKRDTKRYDFEADDRRMAEEIVAEINQLRR